jgi:two-component system, NarL family, sensor histidine kinase UhpB
MLKAYCLSLLLICQYFFVSAQSRVADSLFGLLNKAVEDTGKVTLYQNLAANLKFTDPEKAIAIAQKGILLARRLGFDRGSAGCYLNVSTAYIYSDKLDTALLYLDTALQYSHKVGDPNRLGLAYLNRADIYRQLQNFSQSLKDCETALEYADKANNDDVRARINQTIGAVYYRQERYAQCIDYHNKAIALYRKIGNQRMSAAALNNLGMAYKSTRDFDKAIAVTTDAVRITDSLKDITNLSIYNGNLSDAYFEKGDYASAEKYANKSMEYAVLQKNEYLQAIANVFKGGIYAKQKRYPAAIEVLEKAMSYFREIEDQDRIYNVGDLLAEVHSLAGNYSKAYEYMKISKVARDSLVKWRYDDDVAAMQTKFQVKEKDSEIQLLAKDKELQRQKLQRQQLLIIAVATIALLILCGAWLLMNRRKLKQQMKVLELRNRIAADLHDEVGSSLSSIHMLSQMATRQGNETGHTAILARMSSNAKETMDKMGDIVWMIKPGETEAGSLKERMERFAYEICSTRNIEVSIQLEDLDKVKLTMAQRKNIYLIFKEALNNAVKYSGTEKIDIKTDRQNKQLALQIKDYGKGFNTETTRRGNGLDNMKNRAAELDGRIEFRSAAGEGTLVQLLIPQ